MKILIYVDYYFTKKRGGQVPPFYKSRKSQRISRKRRALPSRNCLWNAVSVIISRIVPRGMLGIGLCRHSSDSHPARLEYRKGSNKFVSALPDKPECL
ncbi:MAG: hypothetical protein A4E57_00821 [Syntrophorhabdaceae bacterium PtaU1.Bin034]|nr:MAG: hypothetical protein A4E57_00821 [Syntrophorhabdaceae bacterium PtaU1.Bin034]